MTFDVAPRDAYDALPYTSVAFAETHPARLHLMSHLFGGAPADITTCRVLEVGCAQGVNLTAIAASLPRATCVGVDISSRQISAAKAHSTAAGVRNVSWLTGEAHELGADLTFDYIILHGIWSWITADVRARLLPELVRRLAPRGVLYLSYDTYPGAHLRHTARDVMRHAASQAEHTEQGFARAMASLKELAEVSTGNALYRQVLQRELRFLEGSDRSLISHDHLAGHYEPFHFRELADSLQAAGLQYLCDASYHGVFPFDLQAPALAWARRQGGGLHGFEQALDALRGQTFRRSLFVRQQVQLDRRVSFSRLQNLRWASPAVPVVSPEGTPTTTYQCRQVKVAVQSPLVRAALDHLCRIWPRDASIAQLLEEIPGTTPTKPAAQALATGLLGCIFRGLGEVAVHRCAIGQHTDRPCVWPVARAEADAEMVTITTRRHTTARPSALLRALVVHCDGTRDPAALIAQLSQDIAAGRLSADKMPEDWQAQLPDMLTWLARMGLLQDEPGATWRNPTG